jgi:2,3-bisphosphoglycerate-independent phosphoglycerate mutase
MSALEITELLILEIEKETADFICLNYANADMVGHTGVFAAAIKAVETVDACVKRVVTAALAHGYTILLTADHGNADYMINEDGTPNTAHTLNPVPLFLIDTSYRGKLLSGKLGDLAPTILQLLNISIPAEMTGQVLITETTD